MHRGKQSPVFPAMEELIERLAVLDILVLSGFMITSMKERAEAVLKNLKQLEHTGSYVIDQKGILFTTQSEATSILEAIQQILAYIHKRLLEEGEIPKHAHDADDIEAIRDKLKRAFPGISI
jgi:hypothetical protein